jgi:hypothetical protein
MEHQQRNCNLLPTILQHLEVKTEQEAEEEEEEEEEAEAEAEAGAEVEAEEHQHLLHHQFHSLLLLHHRIINL